VSTVHINTAPTPNPEIIRFNPNDRRHFIGGSDARIIMGDDQDRLIRLWREKRGEVEPEDLSDNLIVQLGTVTENLNRRWYERNSGHVIKDVQKRVQHPVHNWMAATLDGLVDPGGGVGAGTGGLSMLPIRSSAPPPSRTIAARIIRSLASFMPRYQPSVRCTWPTPSP